MTPRSFVVARGEGAEREYFAGIDDFGHVATTRIIFLAFDFDTEAEAKECAKVLVSNGLTGFATSEITSGASDNLKGETE